MIEPLLEICANRVANCIYDGELRNLDWKLDEKLSNIVFEQFYEMDKKITEEDADEISKKLKVTKMILDRRDFDEIHQKMVFSQNLEQLQLDEPGSRAIFRQFNLVTDEKYDASHDVIDLLKRLLNGNSLKKLQKLHISTNLYFRTGWIREMSEELPSIGKLELIIDHMHQIDFIDLCNCFKNITKLEFWGSDVTSLNGISELENLEILNLQGLNSFDVESVMDLFKLKKLKVLDISGTYFSRRNLTKNVLNYLACDEYLPELRYIDCSFNDMTLEMLQKLVNTHPRIETIGLIGTPINKTPQLQNKNVKLLTEENLKCCMGSLEHFSKVSNIATEGIIESIMEIISANYEQQTESDLHNLFNQLIPLVPKGVKTDHYAINCLEELSRGNRMRMFDINERQSLIKMLLFLSQKWFREVTIRARFLIPLWRILNNYVLLNTKTENANEICERATVMVLEGAVYGDAIYNDCLQVMTKSMRQMKLERLQKMENKWELTQRLQWVMITSETSEENYRLLFKLTSELYVKFSTKSIPKSRAYIDTLMNNMKNDYKANANMHREILKTLEEIVVLMDPIVYAAFFTEDNYKIIKLLLSNENTKKLAISLLVTLYSHTEEGKELSKEERVEDILKIIRKYEAVNGSDRFGMFRSIIATSESEETISWAKWILSHFEEFKEPRDPKRRRVQ